MPTYVIGDIHGRSDLLQNLLTKLEPRPNDHVVFLGDYIDRGPDSRGVIDALLDFQSTTDASVAFLMGNHEQWLLQTMRDFHRHSWVLGMKGLTTVRSYSPEAADLLETAIEAAGPALIIEKQELPYQNFLSAMPGSHQKFFIRLKTFMRTDDVVCSHAGVSADCEFVEQQSDESLIWGQPKWWQNYRGADRIAYGHWGNADCSGDSPRACVTGNTFGIDCSTTGHLMAVRFPDLARWVVV
jgi:Calcineurin-like phosphoesterase